MGASIKYTVVLRLLMADEFQEIEGHEKSMGFCLCKFPESLLKVQCIESNLFPFKCQVCLNFK